MKAIAAFGELPSESSEPTRAIRIVTIRRPTSLVLLQDFSRNLCQFFAFTTRNLTEANVKFGICVGLLIINTEWFLECIRDSFLNHI